MIKLDSGRIFRKISKEWRKFKNIGGNPPLNDEKNKIG